MEMHSIMIDANNKNQVRIFSDYATCLIVCENSKIKSDIKNKMVQTQKFKLGKCEEELQSGINLIDQLEQRDISHTRDGSNG